MLGNHADSFFSMLSRENIVINDRANATSRSYKPPEHGRAINVRHGHGMHGNDMLAGDGLAGDNALAGLFDMSIGTVALIAVGVYFWTRHHKAA